VSESVAWFDTMGIKVAVVDVKALGVSVLRLAKLEIDETDAGGAFRFIVGDGVWKMAAWRDVAE